MENNTIEKVASPSKRNYLSWTGIALAFSTFAIIVLMIVYSFSFYRISILGKRLQIDNAILQQRVQNIQINLDEFQQQAQKSRDEVTSSLQAIQKMQDTDKNTWKVSEAQYYVKLASIELEFQRNLPQAIQLLQNADKEIQAINDSKFDFLRKALADDIASLQNTAQVDYTGIYLRLSALDNQINSLPFVAINTNNTSPVAQDVTNQPWWKKGLIETWQGLQKIVVVRYHSAGVPPLVTPDQQTFIRQNIHAMYAQAMWAVLNKKNDIYQASLQQASQWIQQYFAADAQSTQNQVKSINELKQIDINPTLPKITASEQAFHDYFEKVSA